MCTVMSILLFLLLLHSVPILSVSNSRHLLTKAIEEALSQDKAVLVIPEDGAVSLLQFHKTNRTMFNIDFTKVNVSDSWDQTLPDMMRIKNWNVTLDEERGLIGEAGASSIEEWNDGSSSWSKRMSSSGTQSDGSLSDQRSFPLNLDGFSDSDYTHNSQDDSGINSDEDFSTRSLSTDSRKKIAEKLQAHLTNQENLIGGTLVMKGDIVRAFIREGYKVSCVYRYLGNQGYDVEISCHTEENDYRKRRQLVEDRGDPYSNPTRFIERPRRSVRNPDLVILITEDGDTIITTNKTLAKRSTGTKYPHDSPTRIEVGSAIHISDFVARCNGLAEAIEVPVECVYSLKVLSDTADCYHEYLSNNTFVFDLRTDKQMTGQNCTRRYRLAVGLDCSTVKDPDFFDEEDFIQLKKEQEDSLCGYTIGGSYTKIKECEEYTEIAEEAVILYSGVSKVKTVFRHGVVRKWYDPSKRVFYSCSRACHKGCSGDQSYRSHVERHGKAELGYCEADHSKFYIRAMFNGISVGVGCTTSKLVTFRYAIGVSRKMVPIGITGCVNGVLNFKPLVEGRVIRICSSASCVQLSLEAGGTSIIVPTILLGGSSSLTITDYAKSGSPLVTKASCSLEDACDVIDCNWCLLRFAHPHCLSTATWLVLTTGCSVLVATLIIFMSPLFRCIASSRLLIWVGSKVRRLWKKPVSSAPAQSSGAPTGSDGQGEVPQRRVGARLRLPLIHVLNFMVFLMTHPGLAMHTSCRDFSLLSSEVLKCQASNGCKNKTITRVNFDELMDESCLLYESERRSVLSAVHLKVTDVHFTCSEDTLYYVPDTRLSCSYKHNCPGVDGCSTESCARHNEDKSNSSRTEIFGLSGCLPACGCWGCGCFICSDSCLFYNATLVNQESKSYRVITCTEAIPTVTLSVTTHEKGREEVHDISLSSNVPKRVGMHRIKMESIRTPAFGDTCYAISGASAWDVPCNKRGELVKGKFGEIQCDTESDANKLNPKRCRFNRDTIKIEGLTDQVSCALDLTTPFNDEALRLPLTQGSELITLSEKGTIISSPAGGIGLSLTISSDSRLAEVKINENTCSIRSVSVSGCYSCRSGAIIRAEATSFPNPETAVVTCPGAESKGLIWLSDSWKVVHFGLRFTHQSLKETCVITCSGSNITFALAGSLTYMPNHDPRTLSTMLAAGNAGDSINWDSLAAYLKMPWVGTTITLILSLTAFLIIFPVILRLVATSIINLKRD